MSMDGTLQKLSGHLYLVQIRQGEDVIELRLDATSDIVTRIGGADPDEPLIVEATISYLLARQRADDLPPELDLEDIACAYEGYIDEIRHQLANP
jgi:hypothetical protein